ncbi:hypothetical protein Vretimale_10846 [Volvox reticuliferus]|nr:hypothetical protein Vretimale_10846 [Volvox reticuliferus]
MANAQAQASTCGIRGPWFMLPSRTPCQPATSRECNLPSPLSHISSCWSINIPRIACGAMRPGSSAPGVGITPVVLGGNGSSIIRQRPYSSSVTSSSVAASAIRTASGDKRAASWAGSGQEIRSRSTGEMSDHRSGRDGGRNYSPRGDSNRVAGYEKQENARTAVMGRRSAGGNASGQSPHSARRYEGDQDRVRAAQRRPKQVEGHGQGGTSSEGGGSTATGRGGDGGGRTAAAAAAGVVTTTSAPLAVTATSPSQPLQQQHPGDQRVVLPEGVYPTFVPRNPGIQDGQWNSRDEGMVELALQDAAAVVVRSKSQRAGVVILGSELTELELLAERYGQPRFRAKQLLEGVLKGAHSVEEISTIPKEWRTQLLADGVRSGRSLLHHSVGDEDGTKKFLLQLHDGRIVETVGIPTEDRLTVCVSSQVGCPMRCTFCATGKGGFARNLAPYEIMDQVLTVQELFGRRVSNVVFMGMGEPLLNLPAVVAAYQGLNQQIGIGGAFITISTVGVPNAIPRLAASGLKVTLAVSLHAPNQALRESIIPSAKAYPLEALMEDCVTYYRISGRRVTFEYTLLSGVNDEIAHAKELAALLRRYNMMSHVNIIPWNPVDESEFIRPSRNRVYAFRRAVEATGLPCTVRETRGLEAAAACGQLRNSFQKQPLPGFQEPL